MDEVALEKDMRIQSIPIFQRRAGLSIAISYHVLPKPIKKITKGQIIIIRGRA
jgi:hypothetical protein